MFANFTEETCTGTGTTLALAGASAGHIPFSASFADGDLVSYVVEDSGGSIKVAGIGTYVAATDDITRNDTWNYNGTVVDTNPSANIALSAGVHTIRCDLIASGIMGLTGSAVSSAAELVSAHIIAGSGYLGKTLEVDKQYSSPFLLKTPKLVSNLYVQNNVAVAGSLTEIGLSRMVDGKSDSVYLARGNIDTTITGNNIQTAVTPILLEAGWYVTHIVSTGAVEIEYARGNWSPMGDLLATNRHGVCPFLSKTTVGRGTLTSDPSTGFNENYNSDHPLIRLS
jgi:hypothetical protein